MSRISQDGDGPQCAALRWLDSDVPIELVSVALLQQGESPRVKGDSKVRNARLRLSMTGMSPVIVHRSTMGIIDGRARVAAARCRHQDIIAARFFEGTVPEAFVLGVIANLTPHGRSLSRQDRKTDAARILGMYPGWSDHMVASTVGLSAPVVAAIRGRSTQKTFQLNTRQGRDGKTRPMDATKGRRAAAALMLADATLSLREVARLAGVSVGTAHDVHRRLAEGREPSASKTRRGPSIDFHVARGQAVLTQLDSDPSIATHDDGKAVLWLLHSSLRLVQQVSAMITKIPEHCPDHGR